MKQNTTLVRAAMARSKKEWREFERTISFIEKTLAPQGAEVKTPDRIRDLDGGLREVDASIRFTVGTVPILITVECRKRSARQDKTWIEQLATKQQNLRASRTIAVSSSPFSASSKKLAARLGIELREVRNITATDIQSWLAMTEMSWHHNYAHLKNVEVFVAETDYPALQESMTSVKDPAKDILFYRSDLEHPVTALDILNAIRNQPDFYTREYRTRVTERFEVKLPPGVFLSVRSPTEAIRLTHLFLTADFWTTEVRQPMGASVAYAAPGKAPIHHVQFPGGVLDGSEITLGLTLDTETRCVSVGLQVVKPKTETQSKG